MENKKIVIIVAGGQGKRMRAGIPKQFLPLDTHSVIEHTILAFLAFDDKLQIIVVIPQAHQKLWDELSPKIIKNKNIKTTYGGETRFQSVANGLKLIVGTPTDLVAIHDAVRPLFSSNLLSQCFSIAKQYGNAIPAVDVVETLRKTTELGSEWVDRSNYKAIQTPQTFTYEVLKTAYQQNFCASFTDDASVVEKLGHKIRLIEGERNNIKITTQEDLRLAKLLITK